MALAKITVTPASSGRFHDVHLFDVTVVYLLNEDRQPVDSLEQQERSSTSYIKVASQQVDSGTVLLSLRGVRLEQFSPKLNFNAFDIEWDIDFTFGPREMLQCYLDTYVYAVMLSTNQFALVVTPLVPCAGEYPWKILIGRYKTLLRGVFTLSLSGPQTDNGCGLPVKDQEVLNRFFLTPLNICVPVPYAYCMLHDDHEVWVGRENDPPSRCHKVSGSLFYAYTSIPEECTSFNLFKHPTTVSSTESELWFRNKNYVVRYNHTRILSVAPAKPKS